MPVSPEFGTNLARPVVDLYLDAEAVLLRAIADRIARGIDSDDWAARKLSETSAVQRDIRTEIARLEREAPKAVREAVASAHERGASEGDKDLERAGAPKGTAPVPTRRRASQLDVLTDQGVTSVRNTHLRILRQTDDAYRRVVTEASARVGEGAITRRQAAQQALDRLLGAGITGFVDSAGRAWNLASYVEMATRAVTSLSAIDGHVNRLTSKGHDLAIVSDAPEECSRCRPWEGRVISMSGVTKGYLPGGMSVAGSLQEATAAGLFHIGCRHSLGLFIPGITRPYGKTADPIGNVAREEQRYLERGTRAWKRRGQISITPEARAKAEAKAREWQARLREHVRKSDGKRLRYREQIGAAI